MIVVSIVVIRIHIALTTTTKDDYDNGDDGDDDDDNDADGAGDGDDDDDGDDDGDGYGDGEGDGAGAGAADGGCKEPCCCIAHATTLLLHRLHFTGLLRSQVRRIRLSTRRVWQRSPHRVTTLTTKTTTNT